MSDCFSIFIDNFWFLSVVVFQLDSFFLWKYFSFVFLFLFLLRYYGCLPCTSYCVLLVFVLSKSVSRKFVILYLFAF